MSNKRLQRARTAGFTLVELLVVIAIIAILATVLLPALQGAFRKAEIAQARSEIKSIEAALRQYYSEYAKFPQGNGQPDTTYGAPTKTDNAQLMNVLRSIDDVGNLGYANNYRKIVFLEVSTDRLVNNGFVDPWDVQYRITVDTDFNNEVIIQQLSNLKLSGRTIAVWSSGPDKTVNTSDDVVSWK